MAESIANVTVLIMSAPGRDAVWARSRASIEASDIGDRYERHEHPPGITVRQHFLRIMDAAVASKSSMVLFLEDDVLVNRHVIENVRSWKDVDDPRFGAGWLINPGAAAFTVIDYIYGRRADGRGRWWNRPNLHLSAALLFRRTDLPRLLDKVREWHSEHPGSKADTDLAVSNAVHRLGKQICVHAPSLAEHPIGPSALGHHHHPRLHTSNGTFREHWTRGQRT